MNRNLSKLFLAIFLLSLTGIFAFAQSIEPKQETPNRIQRLRLNLLR